MFNSRYGWCRTFKNAAMIASRLGSNGAVCRELEAALGKAEAETELRAFIIAFCAAVEVYGRLPDDDFAVKSMNVYFRGCLNQTMLDAHAAGFRMTYGPEGLQWYDPA